MSSTERAPEPTMEEILASIRRIITDDEAGQAKKAGQQAQPEDEGLEGEADNQIINDIARVLSGSAPQTVAEEEEEILDLTSELGGLEIVEEEEVVEITEVADVAEVLDLGGAESAVPEFVPAEEAALAPEPMMEAEPPVEEAAPEEPVLEMAPPPEMAAPEQPVPPQPEPPVEAQPQPQQPQPQAPRPSASLEAASALERAIAALRAGQVPTSTTPQAEPFRFQAAPQPEPMPEPTFISQPPEHMAEEEPQPLPMAVPMEEQEPEAETHPEPEPMIASELEGGAEEFEAEEFMGEPEPELVLTEVEMTVAAEPEEPAEMELTEEEPAYENAPFWPSETPTWQPEEPEPAFEPEPEPEPVAAYANGASAHHDEAGKSLEDSVKDMLRPMLREWLDENMPRIVREMDPEALRRYQD
jgi:cell pole-organizing protein PopZ